HFNRDFSPIVGPDGGFPELPSQGCPALGLFQDGHFRKLSGPPGSDFNRLIRGGAPTAAGLECLKKLGVSAVVDLRDEGEGSGDGEETAAAALGLSYRKFPMSASGGTRDKDGCAGLKPSSVERNRESVRGALEFIDERLRSSPLGKVFVHCAHGQDRTGLLLGAYRLQADEYSKGEVSAEMRSYRYTPYCSLEEVWKGF
ncbi:MAG: tyrosine-protein phosphatase, partial [Elusimicrobiota bacterium]